MTANGPSEPDARILVLRGGALGDFILFLPVLQLLREEFPDAHITLGGYGPARTLGAASGYVDETLSLDDPLFARLFSFRPDWSGSDRTFWRQWPLVINYLYDPEGSVQANLEGEGIVRVLSGDPMVREQHAIDHFLKALQPLAIFAEDYAATLPLPEETRTAGAQALTKHGAQVVLLHPGSGSPKKNWPLDRFIGLAGQLEDEGLTPVWVLGEVERQETDPEKLPGAVLPELAVDELAGVASQAAAWIGNDSGATHVAAAAGCRSVVLFGPTDPGLWAPRGGHVQVVQSPSAEMDALTLDAVWPAVQQAVGRA